LPEDFATVTIETIDFKTIEGLGRLSGPTSETAKSAGAAAPTPATSAPRAATWPSRLVIRWGVRGWFTIVRLIGWNWLRFGVCRFIVPFTGTGTAASRTICVVAGSALGRVLGVR